MRKYLIVLIAAIACLLLAAACSKAADNPKEGLEVGNKFPSYDTFAAKTIDGKELEFGDYKGKLLFIDFWATWCAPCRPELPYLKLVQDAYVGNEFGIVGISLDEKISALREMAEEIGLEYPQICDEKGWRSEYVKAFSIRGIPTNFLLDGNGVIIAKDMRGLAVEGHVAKGLGLDKPVVHYAEALDYLGSTDDPDPKKAMALLDKALKGDPEQPEFQFLAGRLRAGTGDLEAAIEHYETGLEHKDRLPVFMPALFAYVGLGHAYLQEGDDEKAVETLDAAIEAIEALDDAVKKPYARYIPELNKLKEQWASGGND